MSKTFFTIAVMFFTSAIVAQNVMISNKNNPNETSIVMNPEKPNYLIAGANLNNYYISSDTGRTWKEGILKSTYGVWGDPIIAVDTAGTFYYFHLSNPQVGSWIDRIICQKSSDNGVTWSNGTYTGLNQFRNQDKHTVVIDRKNNDIFVTWTQFDVYGSSDAKHFSDILFSKSSDGGEEWTNAININTVSGDCVDSDNTVEGAVPAIGPNGEVYVCWAGPSGLLITRSDDRGETWWPQEVKIDDMPGGWDYDIPGIDRSNGLPILLCDLTTGPHRGRLYINWSDQRNGVTDTDVWLSYSDDRGLTWSPPAKVNNDDSKRHQFFTYMAIDQVTGYLYFIFYDRRNTIGMATDVYMAISKDGGKTFDNIKISQSSFTPTSTIFFGDYTGITAHNNIVRPIWTRLHNGQLSIWTDITPIDQLTANVDHPIESLDFEQYPNPIEDYSFVSYKLKTHSMVSLYLSDRDGKILQSWLNEVEQQSGKYKMELPIAQLALTAGEYFLTLKINGQKKTERIIKIN